jgi:DNA-binding transcriptional regulator GbsR (MarR family)
MAPAGKANEHKIFSNLVKKPLLFHPTFYSFNRLKYFKRLKQNGRDMLKKEFIQDYGAGYQMFGLPALMGRIVGLLLYHGKPISLPDITRELGVSKGPVSQICRRLLDHNLIQRVWKPGSRKDYYQAHPNIFGNAFMNHFSLQKKNLELAQKFQSALAENDGDESAAFKKNMDEMAAFYELMIKHHMAFYHEWMKRKEEATNTTCVAI